MEGRDTAGVEGPPQNHPAVVGRLSTQREATGALATGGGRRDEVGGGGGIVR